METQLIASSEKSLEEKLEIILKTGKSSLVDHFDIYHSGDEHLPPAPFHYEISRILLENKENFAIEAFRESGKTSMVVLDYPTYILQFPKPEINYIVIIKQNQKLAEDKLRQIILAYTSNPILCCNLKKIIRQSASVFEVEVNVGDGTTMNILFEAYGKGAALRGLVFGVRRPNLVLMDDPQDFEDSRSETVLERDWEWFLSDVKPLGKSTRIFLIGNNLGEKCLIERVFRLSKELNFETLRIPAIMNGSAVWPEKFDLEFLENEKMSYSAGGKTDIWFRERMCESLNEETAHFKKDWFNYFRDNFEFPSGLRTFTTVDLAIKMKETSDYSVILTCGVDKNNKKYVLEYTMARLNPSEVIEEIFRHHLKYDPYIVGIETVAYQEALSHFLKLEMKRRQQFFRVEEIVNVKVKKSTRIEGLIPHYSNGLIYHRAGHCADLERQLLQFRPDVAQEHDDVIDCLAMQLNLWQVFSDPQKNPLSYVPNSDKIAQKDLEEAFEGNKSGNFLRPVYKK